MSMSLTVQQQTRLTELETKIWNHAKGAKEALMEIRDQRLYRDKYDTFEEYTSEVLGIGRGYIDRVISYEKLKTTPIGVKISNEGQAREISKIPEPQREAVMEEVQKNGPVTARSIRETAARVIDVPPEPIVRRDLTGYAIPDHKVSLFDRSEEVEKVLRNIASVRGALQTAQDAEDRLWQPVIVSAMMTKLDGIYAELKTAVPYAVCPYCSGQTTENCLTCKGRGVISKFTWDTAVPSDLKAVRAACSVKEK